jgi:peptidoglycan/LPS O-acetylase OafA/YrhL
MAMLIIGLILGALTVARATRLLVADRLTVSWRRWVVNKLGAESLPSYLVHCPWCMSLWIAIPVMPVAVLFPNRWVIAALAVLPASYITGLLAKAEGE